MSIEQPRGRCFTLEHRQRISEALMGNKNQRPRPQTLETRKKISETKRRKFASGELSYPKGSNHPNWKGGRIGYRRREGRVIAGKLLGRPLSKREVVHHIDKNPHNNANDNLLICTWSYHIELHNKIRAKGGELPC